jgi:type III restriction enzyme
VIPAARVIVTTTDLQIDVGGVRAGASVRQSAPSIIEEQGVEIPDVLTLLQDTTQLTRRSIAQILVDSGRMNDLRRNPQRFLAFAAEAIERTKRLALVDGIQYHKLGDREVWAQELFVDEELKGYIDSMLPSTKSPYEYVVYDSPNIERGFAEDCENNEAVKVYAKLPSWFKIPTPLGDYNPDWAVLVERDGQPWLYFVVETKGSLWAGDLRVKENAKTDCGRAHFAALAVEAERPARYMMATSLEEVLNTV